MIKVTNFRASEYVLLNFKNQNLLQEFFLKIGKIFSGAEIFKNFFYRLKLFFSRENLVQ